MSAGKSSTGRSETVTVKLASARLPRLSVDQQLTLVVPTENIEPDAWSQVNPTTPSTKSTADTRNATARPAALVAPTAMSSGIARNGGVVSRTVTPKVPNAVLPPASLAEHCTVRVPSGNVEPDTGLHATSRGPSAAS